MRFAEPEVQKCVYIQHAKKPFLLYLGEQPIDNLVLLLITYTSGEGGGSRGDVLVSMIHGRGFRRNFKMS